jgi:hypothetical protein
MVLVLDQLKMVAYEFSQADTASLMATSSWEAWLLGEPRGLNKPQGTLIIVRERNHLRCFRHRNLRQEITFELSEVVMPSQSPRFKVTNQRIATAAKQ